MLTELSLTAWESKSDTKHKITVYTDSVNIQCSANELYGHMCVRERDFLFVCLYNCSYSQCGLLWFQGVVSLIPPISRASLQDVLGSLMLSIVRGAKPLPIFLSTLSPVPSVLPFLVLIFFLLLITISLHLHQLNSLHWLMDGPLLLNCLCYS